MKNIIGGMKLQLVSGQCEYHGDWRYKTAKFLATRGGQCPECVEINKQKQIELENKKAAGDDLVRQQKAMQSNFDKAAIPKRYVNRTFDNYNSKCQQQQLAVNISRHYATHFQDRLENGGGLILQGKPGTGKTHLACAIANLLVTNGFTVRFTTVMHLIRAIRATWKRDSEKSESDVLDAVIDYDLLIIDEIGVQYGSESEKLILFDVLNGRYESVKPTILLTNLVGQELNACIGERNVDRIQEGGGATVSFTWSSYRQDVYQDQSLKSPSCADVVISQIGVA